MRGWGGQWYVLCYVACIVSCGMCRVVWYVPAWRGALTPVLRAAALGLLVHGAERGVAHRGFDPGGLGSLADLYLGSEIAVKTSCQHHVLGADK